MANRMDARVTHENRLGAYLKDRRAKLDPKYFRDDRPNQPDGRNIRHVLQIAEALDASPIYLLGLTDSAPPVEPSAEAMERVAFVSSIAAHLYVAMAHRNQPARVDAERLAKMVVNILDYTAAADS